LQPQTTPSTGAQYGLSLFQQDLIGLRVVASRNWRMRRAGAVAYLDQVHW